MTDETKNDNTTASDANDSITLDNVSTLFPTQEQLLNPQPETTETATEDTGTEKEPELSEIEKEAVAQGWLPQDQFKGNPDNWRTPRAYIDRTKLTDRLSKQSWQIKQLNERVNNFAELTQRQAQLLAEEKSNEALQMKRAAIESGDVQGAEQFEKTYNKYQDEIKYHDSVSKKYKDAEESSLSTDARQAAERFEARNSSWFKKDTIEHNDMMNYAIKKDEELANKYPNLTHDERLIEVEKAVRSFYSSQFDNPRTHNKPSVEKKSDVQQKTKMTYADLSLEEQKFARDFATAGVMSVDDYAEQLYITGMIKK